MVDNAADGTAVENAHRDIDRYISEMSEPASNNAQLLSPSQRLRELGKQRQGSSTIEPAAEETTTALLPNEF